MWTATSGWTKQRGGGTRRASAPPPHGGPLDAVLLDAEHGHEEEVRDLVGGRRAEPAVDDARHVLPAAVRGPLRPLHDVHALPEVPPPAAAP